MKKQITLFVGLLFFSVYPLFSQTLPEWDAAKIKLQLEKLNTLGSVLYVGAHPDDENTNFITFMSNGKKYRTAYLSLNRGDGGQNLIGNEQGSYIGLMRTEELLEARKRDGGEQFFTHTMDFGFSKTAKETLKFWGHDEVLSDVVWIVRKYRPDIMVCRFPEDERAGHGNHWASAILAHEAFRAAADPTRFSEQLKYVEPWQPKRIVWDIYSNFFGVDYTEEGDFSMNIGGYNPLLGDSYSAIAARSRSMHKSQAMGTAPTYGNHEEFFKTIGGSKPVHSLMDGVNLSWSETEGGEKAGQLLKKTLAEFDMNHPEKSVPALLKIREAFQNLQDTSLRNYKTKQVDDLILASSALLLNMVSPTPYAVAGEQLRLSSEMINRTPVTMQLNAVEINGQSQNLDLTLQPNEPDTFSFQVTVPKTTPISQPYWLREEPDFAMYKFKEQHLVGKPMNNPSLSAIYHLTIDGKDFEVSRPVVYKHTDAVRGQIIDDLVIAPTATANISKEVYVFSDEQPQSIKVNIKGFKANISGVAHLETPKGFQVKDNDQSFSLKEKGDEKLLNFTLLPTGPGKDAHTDFLKVHLRIGDQDFNRGMRIIDYNHIPKITVFPFAKARLTTVPLSKGKGGNRIGYIMGAGDKIPQSLEQIGYDVKLLSDEELTSDKLAGFDAVVIGIRAYNNRPHLVYVKDQLMDYVKNGGVLVDQYNVYRGLLTQDIGPYPFKVVNKRVTDENSPVKFLLPDDPILNYPNKITQDDFKGWVQERGLYFVEGADSHYRAPLAMKDPDEDFMDGSLIVTDYGKGKFVYTSLDFFRQLPAGVPGGFRLFVNLISK